MITSTATLAKEQDILRLAATIKDNWTLCEFMGAYRRASESEMMVAQTIHACRINHQKGRGLFSFKGNGLKVIAHGGLVDSPTAYATLLSLEYFVEDDYEERAIIRPTQILVDALDTFLAN